MQEKKSFRHLGVIFATGLLMAVDVNDSSGPLERARLRSGLSHSERWFRYVEFGV